MGKERIQARGEAIGPYEVVRVVAAGGMGVIYEARPKPGLRDDLLQLGIERVAVKVARLDAGAPSRQERRLRAERIDREFQTLLGLTRLGHPNVVEVYDWGWDEGLPYYAMELVDGVTLSAALEERPRVGQVSYTFAKLCGAVAFLHHGGLCHRDLEPSNVLLRVEDGEPVLIDFGLCLPPTGRALTGPGELLGMAASMSPEYVAHLRDGARGGPYLAAPTDDVWALGVMLYEILSGGSPWRTPPERREPLFEEIQTVTPPHPSEVYERSPRALGDVAMRMLEKDVGKRPENASSVLTLLGEAGEKSDVLSPIPPRRGGGSARKPTPSDP